jgi:hypothetical protein
MQIKIMNKNNLPSNKFCCAFCDSKKLSEVIDFGSVALAGGFLKPKSFAAERKYPLRVYFCEDCYAVQVVDIIPADVLFNDYFYFSLDFVHLIAMESERLVSFFSYLIFLIFLLIYKSLSQIIFL